MMKTVNGVYANVCKAAHANWVALVPLGVVASISSHPVWAQATDPLTEAEGFFQRGMGLAITGAGAFVVLICIAVIIASLMQVARERKSWGEVMGSVVGAGVIALVVVGLTAFAVTQTAAISAA